MAIPKTGLVRSLIFGQISRSGVRGDNLWKMRNICDRSIKVPWNHAIIMITPNADVRSVHARETYNAFSHPARTTPHSATMRIADRRPRAVISLYHRLLLLYKVPGPNYCD